MGIFGQGFVASGKSECVALRVANVVASVDIRASGPSYSVTRLVQSLAARGVAVELMSIGNPRQETDGSLRTRIFSRDYDRIPVARELYLSQALNEAIATITREGAVLHCHGLWRMPNVFPSWYAERNCCPLVHSPRGMLGEAALQISPIRKQIFAALVQRRALQSVDCFHATSWQELEEIRAYGLDKPVAVIPNGVDVHWRLKAPRLKVRRCRTALYLGRVHPKKGLDRLIGAWSFIERNYPEWQLRIVGPSEGGHGDKLKRLAASLGLGRIVFENGLYGEEKDAAFREADVFVLPTLNENFGMVVAEALANGTPVITTKGAPWKGLVDNDCGWWIDQGVEPLAAALSSAMAMPRAVLDEMGERGRMWMVRDFSWERVATEMESVYQWCAGNAERPECVSITP